MQSSSKEEQAPVEYENPLQRLAREQAENNWQCPVCTNFVPKSSKQCQSCYEWKPGYEPTPAELAESEKRRAQEDSRFGGDFGASNDSTSTFQFSFGDASSIAATSDINGSGESTGGFTWDSSAMSNSSGAGGSGSESSTGFVFGSPADSTLQSGGSSSSFSSSCFNSWRTETTTTNDQSSAARNDDLDTSADSFTGFHFGLNDNPNAGGGETSGFVFGVSSSLGMNEDEDCKLLSSKQGCHQTSRYNAVTDTLGVRAKKEAGLLDDLSEEPLPVYFPFSHDHESSEEESEKDYWLTSSEDEDNDGDCDDDVFALDDDSMVHGSSDQSGNHNNDEDGGSENMAIIREAKSKITDEVKSRRKKLVKQLKQRRRKRRELCALIDRGDLEERSDLIMVCGEGGLSGVLGRKLKLDEYAVDFFPSLVPFLTNMSVDFVVAGSMNCLVVCDNATKLYGWGNNEQTQLGCRPKSVPDLGDDDNELDTEIVQKRVKNGFKIVMDSLYLKYSPNDQNKVEKLLDKYCSIASIKQFGVDSVLDTLKQTCIKIAKKYDATDEEISQIEWPKLVLKLTDDQIRDRALSKLYPRVLSPFEDDLLPLPGQSDPLQHGPISPIASVSHSRSKRKRRRSEITPSSSTKKLKRINKSLIAGSAGDAEPRDPSVSVASVSDQNALMNAHHYQSNSGGGTPFTARRSQDQLDGSRMTSNPMSRIRFTKTLDKMKREEDEFQTELSCTYYTPAQLRLPLSFRTPIVDVSVGNCHMAVLDHYGTVYSCGTFKDESGVVGHHCRADGTVTRYQRELIALDTVRTVEESFTQSRSKQGRSLPKMAMIASGANHLLMLSVFGEVWEMGIKQLGQRTARRLQKKQLIPQRVRPVFERKGLVCRGASDECSSANSSQSSNNNNNHTMVVRRGSRKVRFRQIACGEHHNLAISTDNILYSWGQNIFLQCGHPSGMNGYNNVIDAPHRVLFYQSKKPFTEHCENYCDPICDPSIDYVSIAEVKAGAHFSLARDFDGNVWSFGRNACDQLGRFTKREKPKKMEGVDRLIRQERKADLARMVDCLKDINISWIGCGLSFWYAQNADSHRVYAFGDTGEGSCGVGKWRSARGRPVFDERLLSKDYHLKVRCAVGGSNHSMFLIQLGHNDDAEKADEKRNVTVTTDDQITVRIGFSHLLAPEALAIAKKSRRSSNVLLMKHCQPAMSKIVNNHKNSESRKRRRSVVKETDDISTANSAASASAAVTVDCDLDRLTFEVKGSSKKKTMRDPKKRKEREDSCLSESSLPLQLEDSESFQLGPSSSSSSSEVLFK